MKTTLHTGSPELITAEQVKAMNVADHQHLWRVSTHPVMLCTPVISSLPCPHVYVAYIFLYVGISFTHGLMLLHTWSDVLIWAY